MDIGFEYHLKRKVRPFCVSLAGNPNTGKSTIFNRLTGLRQHTGNWTGKTVSGAEGKFIFNGETFCVVDLPGIYSLNPKSADEYAAYNYIESSECGVTIIVIDATCMERNLILALQILKRSKNAIICINLIDEAAKKGIQIDTDRLEGILKVPVIRTSAKAGTGILDLKQAIYDTRHNSLLCALEIGDTPEEITGLAKRITEETVTFEKEDYNSFDRKIDDIVTSRRFGIPIMMVMLFTAFWITISLANYPTTFLMYIFGLLEGVLYDFLILVKLPLWLADAFVFGVYRVLTWVIAVMLPPMAIFFPMFALLEDFGLLPRIAFNMDGCFRKAGAHGKQALTMCMGMGCNAAGVTSCRIIESRREKLIAILTNNFIPCNGRFPSLIAMAAVMGSLYGFASNALFTVFYVFCGILLSIGITLFASKLLSSTVLKGVSSSFVLELPPYRRPQFFKTIVRSIYDKTIKTLLRAICAAAPAGLVLWILQSATINGGSLLYHITVFLDPFGKLIGVDGIILAAFIFGIPANEIVIPIMLLCYSGNYGAGISELAGLSDIILLLKENGWTYITVICTTLLFFNHFPCATTLITIKKETKSAAWTALAFLIPTLTGIVLCVAVSNILSLIK